MRLSEDSAQQMASILNPRGNLAKELEATAKRASWLMLVCEHWLAYKGGDYMEAKYDEPTYDLPKAFEDAARFNKARKACTAWEPRSSRVAAQSTWSYRWYWPDVFDMWFFGAMANALDAIKANLPETNVETIEKEVLV